MDNKINIQDIILNIYTDDVDKNKSKSLYLYGKTGIGKTTIIKDILKTNNIDYLYYDINNLKDRNNFNEIFYSDNGNVNIFNSFNRINDKRIFYIIDNIDHIQNNEKTFLGNIIKAIRPRKKTKKIIPSPSNSKKKIYKI